MSETLLGVIIGGIIGSVPNLVSMIADTRRWKIEMRLEHLRAERVKLEKLSSEVLQKVIKGMLDNDKYDVGMLSDMMVLMPKPVWLTFRDWFTREDKASGSAQVTYMDLCVKTKQALLEVDDKIEKLIGVERHAHKA